MLVYPSREVEAKRGELPLRGESSKARNSDPHAALDDDSFLRQVAPEDPQEPFAQIEHSPDEPAMAKTMPTKPGEKHVIVANGDTLSTIFQKAGIDASVLHDMLSSSRDAKTLARIHVGQDLTFAFADDGSLKSMHTNLSALESISLTRKGESYQFTRDKAEAEIEEGHGHGVIDSSLFLAANRADIPHNVTLALVNAFAYDIDFAQDIREGDSFDVIYEKKVVDGKTIGTGNLLAARFSNRGKIYTAIRYESRNGSVNYYTADGANMRKAFIRTPVDFTRISSRFSLGRNHPLLNKIRAHKGVDYAAPTGTPIKAAGDGRLVSVGRKGGYGNAIEIQHGQKYSTLYGHMSRFAKGMRAGMNVKQGQIIGYVGMTGLATGPHLHYEFRIAGKHVDPLGVKLPMADPIAKSEMPRFLQQSKILLAAMDSGKQSQLALNKQSE